MVVNTPAPYRDPLYGLLAADPELDLVVLFGAERHWDHQWSPSRCRSYPHRVLPNRSPGFMAHSMTLSRFNPTLPAELRRFRPDVLVVYGYAEPLQLSAIAWAMAARIPYLLRGDTNNLRGGRRGPLGLLKTAVVRAICRRAAGALAIGTSNREFWVRHGVAPDRVFLAPYAVRNEHFARVRPAADREALRARLGVVGRSVVLFVGRLIPCKALSTLIEAYAAARRYRPDLALVLVGEGPLRRSLEAESRRCGAADVVFAGAVDQSVLPLYYQNAEMFVLPSLAEQWGLVVNEAMAAGLPVIVSDRVGCHPDLVQTGRNGLVVPAGDTAALSQAILDVLSNEGRRAEMGRESARMIQPWSFDAAANGYRQGIRAATADRIHE